MPPAVDWQQDFVAALLNPGYPIPTGIVGPDGDPCPKRFGVYRNNVVIGLIEILRDVFPAVRRVVGAEFFDAMARAYVLIHGPVSPMLLQYGSGFPIFIEGFGPASDLPYLADVARIEWAWVEAYHAEEAAALSAEDFAELAAEDFRGIRLQLHPSLRIVRSTMPALTIWRMNVDGGEPKHTIPGEGETALILRPDAMVEVRYLPPGAAEFIGAIGAALTVEGATDLAISSEERFDLPMTIAGLLGAGAVCGYRTGRSSDFIVRRVAK